MFVITMQLTTIWKRLCARWRFRFDLAGIALEDSDLQEQLGHGRD